MEQGCCHLPAKTWVLLVAAGCPGFVLCEPRLCGVQILSVSLVHFMHDLYTSSPLGNSSSQDESHFITWVCRASRKAFKLSCRLACQKGKQSHLSLGPQANVTTRQSTALGPWVQPMARSRAEPCLLQCLDHPYASGCARCTAGRGWSPTPRNREWEPGDVGKGGSSSPRLWDWPWPVW